MESSLREKQDSVQREMENMSSRLQQARDETAQEVHVENRKLSAWSKTISNMKE